MGVLQVREYGRIGTGSKFDPTTYPPTVTAAQRTRLERFSETYKARYKDSVFQYGPRQTLVAQNFVGVINLGEDQVEILPKIDGLEGDDAQVRKNLASMLALALDIPLRDGDLSKMDDSSQSILEVLIRLFCRELWTEVHKGLLRRYEARSETLSVMRGRINIERQLRENAFHPERLACDFDEFTDNNRLNQLFKAALRKLSEVSRSSSNQRSVSELLFCFSDVDDVHRSKLRIQAASVDRTGARFGRLLAMAKLFLGEQAPDLISGAGDGFALLFDMNRLFEEYIGRLVRRLFAAERQRVQLQGPKSYLALKPDGGNAFELNPDIVGLRDGSAAWIVDTKWKRLDESAFRDGVSSTDMYQMNAYARRYDCAEVLLLYPHHSNLSGDAGLRAAYHLQGADAADDKYRVRVGTIDLRDLRLVPQQLFTLLPHAALQ